MQQKMSHNFQLFRKNDFEKGELSGKSLAKQLSLFKPSEQTMLMPGTHSFGPYVKSDKSLYYLAPHKLNEYFASEIMLRLGIISPKCRMVFEGDGHRVGISYDLVMTSWEESEDIDIGELHEIAAIRNYRPVLIKQGKQIFLYGTPNGSQWKLSALQSAIFKDIQFEEPGNAPEIKSGKCVPSAIFQEIAAKDAHRPSVIASKSLDGFIPMQLIRRNSWKGEKLFPRHFEYLNAQQRAIHDRYQLDITKQLVYDQLEQKNYRISGNLFATDIAALLICDYDFQSTGSNLGMIRAGNRFHAAAIDKDAVKFNGKSYSELVKKLSHRTCADFLYQSRTDDQVIAMVYHIAQALLVRDNNQCDFDRIFSNSRVQATRELTITPDNRYDNIKKSAQSIVAHYQTIYGEDFLECYSRRELLRKALADLVLSKLECNDSQPQTIKSFIIEDLRGPYYRQFFAGQQISHEDIDNSYLVEALVSDVMEEHGLALCSGSTLSKTI